MKTFENPFSTDRAEQLGNNLFEFYANHKSFEGLLKSKSLILEGGRGSGKTMFYLYNTYLSKKQEFLSTGGSYSVFLEEIKILGIHFRADSNFVPAFQRKGINEDDWFQLFGHYLNLNLSRRIIETIIDINDSLLMEKRELIQLNITEELKILFGDNSVKSFDELLKIVKLREIELISYVNNSGQTKRPNLILNGFLVNLIAEDVLSQSILKNKSIHIFIDEFENMLPYQQKIVNTLIKHPNPVVIDVGMRKGGIKTYETLTDSEIISAPHDFDHFDLEDLSDKQYEELIVEICSKRLSKISELKKANNEELFDIRYYLGAYSLEQEANDIVKTDLSKIQSKIKTKLGSRFNDFKLLYETNDPVLLRLNLILLTRGNKPEELVKELSCYLKGAISKYKDWLHNNKNGIVFLLAKEFKQDKSYSGFNTYKSLSSGITRYFIELCESAFNIAYRNGFDFSAPRILTPSEQTLAAQNVSKYKLTDIETYTPYSMRMRRFVVLLGKVFQALHYDDKLSEPERNHFTTQSEKLSPEAINFLNSAILYSVIQKRSETKDKSSAIDSNIIEYHLNHIYAPYFRISARRIRSLQINYKELEILISGDVEQSNLVANKFVKGVQGFDSNQLRIDL
jgi:hypothetical protein